MRKSNSLVFEDTKKPHIHQTKVYKYLAEGLCQFFNLLVEIDTKLSE